MIEYIISTIILLLSFIIYCFSACKKDYKGSDEKLQNKILSKYKKFKLPKIKKSFDDFCYPKSYSVQPQQAFLGEYMSPRNQGAKPKAMIAYHKIGSGKSCVMIRVGEQWIEHSEKQGKILKPLVLMPASLIPGFRDELRGNCAEFNYNVQNDEKHKLSDKRIDTRYNIMSYNKFLENPPLHATVLMIDEVQNALSENGQLHKAIVHFINKNDTTPILLLTGTPVFDNPKDLISLAQLLRIDADSSMLSPEYIKEIYKDHISFFSGAPPYVFPKTTITIVKCRMSKHQTKWYTSEIEAEKSSHGNILLNTVANNFYIKSRQRSNIVYPNGLVSDAGLDALTNNIIHTSLDTYSCKLSNLMKKLKKNKLSFIYCEFTGEFGIAAIIKCLESYKYTNYLKAGSGSKRYVVWSGDQTMQEKSRIREAFNSEDNDNAERIQIIIGSPAIRSGVNLRRVLDAYVLSPCWNNSQLEQIYGRIIRFCSHKSLPIKERIANIYIYAAVIHSYKESDAITPDNSVDLYMLNMAEEKKEINKDYTQALIDVAIDKKLFQ